MANNSNTISPPQTPLQPWLEGLNEGQSKAVEILDGPVLVLAGAGTGKTRVITTRLAELLYHQKARPYEILCVTFTNKAAAEMRNRTEKFVGSVANQINLGTFHSIGARILRKHADIVGLGEKFTILNADDQIHLIKRILDEQNISIDTSVHPPKLLSNKIQAWKDRGETAEYIAGTVSTFDNSGFPYRQLSRLYSVYQERLLSFNAADFGDLLLYNLEIFKNHKEVLQEYRNRFKYILVDEYQDSNTAQYQWLRLLARGHSNICCVGDDDQSIYGWRGAEVSNILNFKKYFSKAQIFYLERNYRSTSHILGAAAGLISRNKGRYPKRVWTEDSNQGEKIVIAELRDYRDEAVFIIKSIEESIEGTSTSLALDYRDIAILVRAGFQMRAIEDQLLTKKIPYKIIGGPKFYEREEIRDAVAYLRLVANLSDNLAFERIANKPSRGIGKKLLELISAEAIKGAGMPADTMQNDLMALDSVEARAYSGNSYFHCAEKLCANQVLTGQQHKKLSLFLSLVKSWHASLVEGMEAVELTHKILQESGYMELWRSRMQTDPKAATRVENLNELLSAVREFQQIGDFLEHVALVTDQDSIDDSNVISLMTLHASKGLEFSKIFLPCWEEGLFPNHRVITEQGEKGLEEERRLAYVGLTRAEHEVCISYATRRLMHGDWLDSAPSQFLNEIPSENVKEIVAATSYYDGSNYNVHAQPLNQSIYYKEEEHAWRVNDACTHDRFGKGRIIEKDDKVLTIKFDDGETRRILGHNNFLKPIT